MCLLFTLILLSIHHFSLYGKKKAPPKKKLGNNAMIQRLQNFQDRAKKSRNLNIFTFLKTRRQCDFFQIDQKDLFFFQKVGNSGKRGLLVRSRQYDLCFSKNIETVHLRLVQCAKSWTNPKNQWFWWAPGSAIWYFHIFWFLWSM